MTDTANDTTTAGTSAPRRPRGAGFPGLTLSDAVALVKQIAGFGASHNNASLSSALGHTTPNSGPYRSKIAALKDYGLLSGRNDELMVTPLGQELANPGFASNTAADLRTAFEQCQLFTKVLGELSKGQDIAIAGLANHAMNRHGVSAQSKDAFANVFVKSGVTAGVVELVGTDQFRIVDPSESRNDVLDDNSDPGAEAAEGVVRAPGTVTSPGGSAPRHNEYVNAVVNHSWQIDGGVIRFVVETSRTLPASAYGVVGSVIEAGDKLADMLAAPLNPSAGDLADSE